MQPGGGGNETQFVTALVISIVMRAPEALLGSSRARRISNAVPHPEIPENLPFSSEISECGGPTHWHLLSQRAKKKQPTSRLPLGCSKSERAY